MLGFVNVYKPAGMTSSRVVTTIRKRFSIDKIGHMGTLDPIAEGILPLAIGKATRMFDYFLSKTKSYIVTFELGYTTDTLDATGKVTDTSEYVPSHEDILRATSKMLGVQMQMPPKYSAKKVGGKKAYDLARENIDFELKPKEIEISKFEYISHEGKSYQFLIECTSGTYIRAIGRDLGNLIGCPMCMTRLIRSQSGIFTLDNAMALDDILSMDDISTRLLSVDAIFPQFDKEYVDSEECKYLLNGRRIHSKNSLNNHTFVYYGEDMLGVSKQGNGELFLDTHLRSEND